MNHSIHLQKDTLKTVSFEAYIEQVRQDIVRYRRIEQSAELREFEKLRVVVETPDFQTNKQTLLHRRYKDTEEYRMLARHRRLRRSWAVRWYYWLLSSRILQKHIAFSKTEQYVLLQDEQAVSNSAELKEYRAIERSWLFKQYRKSKNSDKVKEFLHLDVEVNSSDFATRNAFWSNPDRWYTTEDSRLDGHYLSLRESDDIVFYLSQNANQIASWEAYSTLFADDFTNVDWAQLGWRAGFHYSNPHLKSDHSYYNEQQANHAGKNSTIKDSTLVVETKQESVIASAWHPTKGFIPKEFAWTGDVLQAAKIIQESRGLFMAKVRVEGVAHAAVYLGSDKRLPLITLMQWDGQKITMGIRTTKQTEQVEIGSIKPSQWFIYSVRIEDKQITWHINNQEVMRLDNPLQSETFYPAVAEYLPEGIKAGVGKVEIDWIRVYKKA